MSPEFTKVIKGQNAEEITPVRDRCFYDIFRSNNKLTEHQKNLKYDDARFVLDRCIDEELQTNQESDPQVYEKRKNILLWGKVQSGKTASLISICALARDREFQIIIMLAGTTNTLLKQTQKRFREDLGDYSLSGISWGAGHHSFYLIRPQNNIADLKIFNRFEFDKDTAANRTSMIFILKNGSQLKKIKGELVSLGSVLDKSKILIIDDESDQSTNSHAASNLVSGENREISRYAELKRLRQISTNISLVQSTATPEAHFLAQQYCDLKPKYVKIVKPGEGYIGGSDLFNVNHAIGPYVKDIRQNQNMEIQSALVHFLLSCMKNEMDFINNGIEYESHKEEWIKTMIFHPGVKRTQHEESKDRVDEVLETLRRFICNEDFSHFSDQYEDWRRSTKTSVPLDELLCFIYVIQKDNINTALFNGMSQAQQYDFSKYKYHILFGGILLDRGMTIPNLMVTFIERAPINSGANDSIQQWGRFFGYKQSFKEHIRIYMTSQLRKHFEDYVKHEKQLRSELEGWEESGLDSWELETQMIMYTGSGSITRPTNIGRHIWEVTRNKAGWVNTNNLIVPFQNLKPTDRENRIYKHYTSFKKLQSWINANNRRITYTELKSLDLVTFTDNRKSKQGHTYFIVGPEQIQELNSLLCSISPGENTEDINKVLNYSLHQQGKVLLIFMHGSHDDQTIKRSMTARGTIVPFQGRDQNEQPNYSGDYAIVATNTDILTVQIRLIDAIDKEGLAFSTCPIPWISIKTNGRYVELRTE